ncbi:TssQ family T6SS-associated lipoprotein [Noviherbaspirillum denitrificans]|uniref:Lipoprotein n=1 Tax=Noviherbaspirillum denitrificans TaxID=1968433 RepID=A0A254TJ03_9BURK|nr:TssQ family T6SS-associated lipoprotein [Noviherbaspirillum denitrificans]OWW22609.1 hypothetical protein AYR66_27015 [Noviherbaspirillum denitrificans]
MPIHHLTLAVLVAALAAGCAQLPASEEAAATMSAPDTDSHYARGLAHYRDHQPDAALTELTAAITGGRLKAAEENDARKHMAFIHCAAGRELPCREQFHAILKSDPDFELVSGESDHPQWGPVWRSIKGADEERRALSQASSPNATPAQQKLAEGIREYEAARYRHALDALQAAVKAGLPAKGDEMRAHKYTAFAFCLTKRMKQCRAEFRTMFEKDPAFALLPSESGHPAWASVYRSEKAAAGKKK